MKSLGIVSGYFDLLPCGKRFSDISEKPRVERNSRNLPCRTRRSHAFGNTLIGWILSAPKSRVWLRLRLPSRLTLQTRALGRGVENRKSAKFRRGSNTVITPIQNPLCGFHGRGKIEEDRGNYVFFSESFLGNFRDAGVFRNFWADDLCGWTAFWGQVLPSGAEPPHAPCREI